MPTPFQSLNISECGWALQAWEKASKGAPDTWTVILEQDAHFVPVHGKTWYRLLKDLLSSVRCLSEGRQASLATRAESLLVHQTTVGTF
eukprot:7023827-Prymnesium_polylepis.1